MYLKAPYKHCVIYPEEIPVRMVREIKIVILLMAQ